MRALALLLCMIWSAMAQAATVRVTSGEHDGFTRLVVDAGAGTGWSLGATPDGYELRLSGPDLAVDLSGAFRLIGRSRIATLEAAPATPDGAALRLVLGCGCHVQAFEFRPGVLVLDVRDGPPPPGSAFEQPLAARRMAESPPPIALRPRPRPSAPYVGATLPPVAPAAPPAPLPTVLPADQAAFGTEAIQTEEARQRLLRDLSDAAARGVVQMALPEGVVPQRDGQATAHAGAGQIRAGLDLGLVILPDQDARPAMMPDGATCLDDRRLRLADWGQAEDVAAQLATARQGLLGEFDHTNHDALADYVRLLLYLGFGAEARQAIESFQSQHEDRGIWAAMASILDGEAGPGPFAGMAACDGEAALWATLAADKVTPDADRAAVIRAFNGLPVHLRRQFAPDLIGKFTAAGDTATVFALQSALERPLAPSDPAAALLRAEQALSAGEHARAEADLKTATNDHSRATETGVAPLAVTLAAQDKPVPPEMITQIEALLHEYRGSPEEPMLENALAIAAAAAGQFDLAFRARPDSGAADPEIWRLLARNAGDDEFLARAVIPASDVPGTLQPGLRLRVAERLLGHGFADHALAWISPELRDPVGHPEAATLAAQANLERGDPAAALRLIAGRDGESAERIRLAARSALQGAPVPEGGPEAAPMAGLLASRAWEAIAESGDPVWSPAAGRVLPQQGPPARPGPVGASRVLLDDSNRTRATLDALLAATAAP
ncbi:hypothetical protein E7811_08030 [Aliigemmobacter aestuarii]|uniref:HEAT repeat domain-containing protein n=1 Tax=Aliigemmobacter aestuarii TaxID=1445661 RepID=A0A4S3MUL3_9RHOB|nr:hypothetical protein [Gemmobacter aestuarii]THD85625.1 hypothetical protein E7811_08030 [Gemmobacter aestuarii]